MNLKDLEKIENILAEIRKLLNPEDSPYVCDMVVMNIAGDGLKDLVIEMMAQMGYNKKMIKKIVRIISKI